MPYDDLESAANAARYLASMSASIRGLMEDDEDANVITKLRRELNQSYADAREAIRNVAMELRRTRDSAVRLGDVVAPTAHEAAIEMVQVLNRERFVVEVISRKQVTVWPDADEVAAEIELEFTKAKDRRENLPDPYLPAESPSECAKRMRHAIDWVKDRIDDGPLRREIVTKRSWRLHREDVRKLGSDLD